MTDAFYAFSVKEKRLIDWLSLDPYWRRIRSTRFLPGTKETWGSYIYISGKNDSRRWGEKFPRIQVRNRPVYHLAYIRVCVHLLVFFRPPSENIKSILFYLSGSILLQIDRGIWKMLSKWSESYQDAMLRGSNVKRSQILKIGIFKFWLQIWTPCKKVYLESALLFF